MVQRSSRNFRFEIHRGVQLLCCSVGLRLDSEDPVDMPCRLGMLAFLLLYFAGSAAPCSLAGFCGAVQISDDFKLVLC